MKNKFRSAVFKLRIIGMLEGISLLFLLFAAVPRKYIFQDPSWVKAVGPVHGILFLWFVFNTLSVAVEQQWKFRQITWKVLLACLVPFGTFYIDRKILKRLD
ncbi:DUF3817 domain-containing protein [Dyadobacter flavalbus]|uniref:DUF3817 domain-containing protein n=1 Tax=Dyadobacter flavalbus TaxID=2579942 RepID=A0A5M8QZA3_9BACT|nr:DUF3817 domain-containing protein [Dyadobacter flavalbus]KAA6439352.1 DUF3817 domain-containing protein [Dyadobacter flavalbus]